MRIITLLTILYFSAILNARAQTEGCSDGNYVYILTNEKYGDCPTYCAADKPLYSKASKIYIQTYANDACGLKFGVYNRNQITHGRCRLKGDDNDAAGLVWYNPNDNTCVTMALPFDDYIPFFLFVLGLFGFYLIQKKDRYYIKI